MSIGSIYSIDFIISNRPPSIDEPATHEAHPIRVSFINRRNGVMLLLVSAKLLADVLEEAGGGLERIEISIGALSVPDDLYACHGDCLLCFDVYSLTLLYTVVNTFSKIFHDKFRLLPRGQYLHDPAPAAALVAEKEPDTVGHLQPEHALQQLGSGNAGMLRPPGGNIVVAGDPALLDQDDQLDPGIVGTANLGHEAPVVLGIGQVLADFLQAIFSVNRQHPAVQHIITNIQPLHPVQNAVSVKVAF